MTEQVTNGIRRRDLLPGSLAGGLAGSILFSPERALEGAAERADVIVIGGEREPVSAVAAGSRAPRLDALSSAERGRFVLDYLARMRPATKGRLEMIMTHSRAEQPCIRGVRHNCAPGRVSRFRDTMRAPHDRLLFAGEHTRRLEVGMESAMESGERAAIEILKRVSS